MKNEIIGFIDKFINSDTESSDEKFFEIAFYDEDTLLLLAQVKTSGKTFTDSSYSLYNKENIDNIDISEMCEICKYLRSKDIALKFNMV